MIAGLDPKAYRIVYPSHALLDHLEKLGHFGPDEKRVLMEEHMRTGRSMESLLLDLQMIQEEELVQAIGHLRGCQVVALTDWDTRRQAAFPLIPYEILERCCALPLAYDPDREELLVAMADVGDLSCQDLLTHHMRLPGRLVPVLGRRSEILRALKAGVPAVAAHSSVHYTVDDQVIHGFLYGILAAAISHQASDIHFEPEKIFVHVRLRCDGLLTRLHSFHMNLWSSLSVQLKVLANMDISETRRPQDGRFSLSILGKPMDFRLASHPTLYGEKIVLRILDPQKAVISLEDLGYSTANLTAIGAMLTRPEGLIVVTGPTGSGKTTTLYSMLGQLNKAHSNIMTLEDPIEYAFSGIIQSEIREKAGLGFMAGIHSILRQDPDVILIGEIRDQETADMAIRASMTGHLVLTTLHTLSALATLYRLQELNIPTSLLAGLLTGIVAQRLVRLLCPQCKIPQTLTPEQARTYGLWPQQDVFQARGCTACRGTGYRGRKAIAETIVPDSVMEDLILTKASHREIHAYLASRGFRTLRDSGLELVLAGTTTPDELRRVLGGA